LIQMSKRNSSAQPSLPDPLTPEGAAALRQTAEAIHRRQAQPQAGTPAGKAPDQERLIEELHIHQIELELQNESLRASRLQLEESLNRYAALYSFAPIALLTLSGNGTIRQANQTAADLLGQPLADLRDRRLGIFVSEATRAAFNDLLASALLGEAGCRRDLVLCSPGQPPRWVQAEGIIDIATADHRPQVQLALIDISERMALNANLEQRVAERTAELKAKITELRQVAERLRDSEERAWRRLSELEAIYATTPVGLVVLDTELRFRHINEGLAAMNGFPVEAHLGRTLGEILPHALAGQVEPQLRQVLNTGEPLHFELAGETPAHPGEWRVWQENVYPFQSLDGKVIGLNIVVEDITERKLAEENLRESERRFRDLFEYLPIAYQSVDSEGRWLDVNQKMADLLGFARPEDMLGLRFVDYWDPSSRDQFETEFARFKENNRIEGEVSLHRRDGTPVTALFSGRIQRDGQGRFLRTHCIIFDITERRAMEDQIRTLNEDLELKVARRTAEARAASAAKSEFLAHMSHEIRTPLNAILGLAQLLERGSLDDLQRQQVMRLQEAGENLLAILNDILDFSKIESGKLSIETQAFDLGRLLSRLDSLLGRAARAKGLSWRIDPPPQPDCALLGDPLRLGQVLTNLIENAIKFTAAGEVSLRIEVQYNAELQGTGTAQETDPGTLRLRFLVEDSGIGIEPEALAGLFQPFTQGDASITRRFGGTGLGLAISKRLVKLMGGEIGAWSQPGRGSTFWCELPFRLTRQTADSGWEPPGVEAAGQRLAGWHLLVVDDSAMNQEVVEQALRLEGAEVTLACDGAEALESLRRHPQAYRAVLMDVQMPVMDGLTAARRIRAELGLSDLPIIALTAGVLSHERQAALAAGMNDILTKPVRLEEMLAMLQRHGQTAAQAGTPVAAFPAIAGIDREQARENLSGNRTLFLRLLGLFLAESAALVSQVREELAGGLRDAAARRLHSLKGNAGSLGAMAIMALAGQLEEAIDGGDRDIDEALAELDHQLQGLRLASAPWLERARPGAAVAAEGE